MANENLNTVIVCPLTLKIKNYYGNLILDAGYPYGLEKRSEVMTIHTQSIAKERLKKKIGMVNEKELNQIKDTFGKILKY